MCRIERKVNSDMINNDLKHIVEWLMEILKFRQNRTCPF